MQVVTLCYIVLVMNFETWLDELTNHETRREIAAKTGYAATTLTRQIDRGSIRPEMVIALCRAYDRSPVQGLVETGYINEYEVQGVDLAIALHDATNEQLLNEIMRRSDPEARYLFGADGDSTVVDLDDAADAAVFDIRPPHVEGLPYAADDSATEPEEGDDDYHDGP